MDSNRVVDGKVDQGFSLAADLSIDCALCIGQVRRFIKRFALIMFDYVNHAQSILLYGQAARAISIG
jgi:hypothetical protein